MTLDIVTLMAVGSLVAALSALVLGGAWILMRERALAWWAVSFAILSLSICFLIAGVLSLAPHIVALGGATSALSPALLWAGMRDFAGRPISLPGLVAGTAFILLVTALAPAVPAYLPTRLAGFVVWIAYLSAAIFELSNRRMEPLRARWMLVVLCAAHAIAFIGGIVDALQGNLRVLGVPLALGSWYSLIHLDSLLYSMGTAVFLVVLCKERSEFNLQKAAGFDSLTGAMARGAFMAQAERLLARARKDGAPLAVVLVDLDRFKTINDTFGHRVGDHVLTVFADATRACLRPTDLFGRHGGEEFAILLPGAGIEEAFQIAERIRVRFIEVCGETGDGISATLSAGIAELGGDTNFEALLDKADKALYQAKNLGRNRIERAEPTDTQRPAISVAWPPKAAAG